MSQPALRLEAVCRSFGGLQAVDGVSIEVRPGERRALIGPNGAGKTTLFNLISGAMPVSSGRIALFGEDVTRAPAHRRAALGLARTFQITNLFPDLTVLENCVLAVQAHSPTRFAMLRPWRAYAALLARARAALDSLELGALGDAVVKNLSHGEQRQLEIALALAGVTKERLRRLIDPVDPLTYADRLKEKRLLLIGASRDDVVPPEAVKRLWEATGRPKILWFDATHVGAAAYAFPAMHAVIAHLKG